MTNGHDPNKMDLEKRLLLAMLLSMAVLLITPHLYQAYFPPPPVPEQPMEQSEQEATPIEIPEAKIEDPPPQPEAEGDWERTEATAREITVENDDLSLRWSTAGGGLQSVLLKKYRAAPDDEITDEDLALEPQLLDVIPQGLPETLPRPLTIRVDDDRINRELETAVYEVVGGRPELLQAPAKFELFYGGANVQVRRKFEIPESGYAVRMETEVLAGGREIPFSIVLGAGIGKVEPAAAITGDFSEPRIKRYVANEVESYSAGGSSWFSSGISLEGGARDLASGARWVGLDSQYFAYLIFDSDEIRSLRLSEVEWKRTEPDEEIVPLLVCEVGFPGKASYSFFAGPKDQEILTQTDPTFRELIDYGWFALLVKPLVFGLKFTYGFVVNYGWSIIILTFVINLALFPVRYKQMASMKKMSALQPKLKSIQDRYKRMKRDDPRKQQMNTEVMALYKENGVNPLGGCLPLVIQMPFLIAFYRMLASSIELRGAPFMGWIQDLSQHDPYYVTPVVMGISMVVQQKMTPATGDPTQRRMMMMLPVVFTFFFLNLSSGLVVYFLFSNLFAMMFQVLMQRLKTDDAPAKKKGSKKGK